MFSNLTFIGNKLLSLVVLQNLIPLQQAIMKFKFVIQPNSMIVLHFYELQAHTTKPNSVIVSYTIMNSKFTLQNLIMLY